MNPNIHNSTIYYPNWKLLKCSSTVAYISLLFLVKEGDYTLNQEDFYGDLYVVKNTHQELSEENIINQMITEEVLSDEVTSVVDNVVKLNANVKIEEYNKQWHV